jgi:hypothetical protein
MKYKTWGEMTRAEKGELLLAKHEGKNVQYLSPLTGDWIKNGGLEFIGLCKYRVKPEITYDSRLITHCNCETGELSTYKITYQSVDGVPDCSTIKMEKQDA